MLITCEKADTEDKQCFGCSYEEKCMKEVRRQIRHDILLKSLRLLMESLKINKVKDYSLMKLRLILSMKESQMAQDYILRRIE